MKHLYQETLTGKYDRGHIKTRMLRESKLKRRYLFVLPVCSLKEKKLSVLWITLCLI